VRLRNGGGLAQVEVGRSYRYEGRDVLIVRKSPAPPGGYYVGWKTIDDAPPVEGEKGEPFFCQRATSLISRDDPIMLGEIATTLQQVFARGDGKVFSVGAKSIGGIMPTLHFATVWAPGVEPKTYPVSVETFDFLAKR